MAEFKNRRVVMRKRARRKPDLNVLGKKEAAKFATAVKRKYHISNFKASHGTFVGDPAIVFTGNYKGYRIHLSKTRDKPSFYGSVQKRENKGRTKRSNTEIFYVWGTLKDALTTSTELIEAKLLHSRKQE
jgi:hypothetical protein